MKISFQLDISIDILNKKKQLNSYPKAKEINSPVWLKIVEPLIVALIVKTVVTILWHVLVHYFPEIVNYPQMWIIQFVAYVIGHGG